MKTTLNEIRKFDPCTDSWQRLLESLGKTEADDTEVKLIYILDLLGIDDAIWALRAVDGHEKEARLFAADCAERVLHLYEDKYPGDDRPRKAIEAARMFARLEISPEEAQAACSAARSAFSAADSAAYSAAYSAADAEADSQERKWQVKRFRKLIA